MSHAAEILQSQMPHAAKILQPEIPGAAEILQPKMFHAAEILLHGGVPCCRSSAAQDVPCCRNSVNCAKEKTTQSVKLGNPTVLYSIVVDFTKIIIQFFSLKNSGSF